jgi:hypothetical protein
VHAIDAREPSRPLQESIYRMSRAQLMINASASFGFPHAVAAIFNLIPATSISYLLDQSLSASRFNPAFAGALGVGYLVTPTRMVVPLGPLRVVARDDEAHAVALANPLARPRARWVPEAEVGPYWPATLSRLRAPGFPHARRIVVAEDAALHATLALRTHAPREAPVAPTPAFLVNAGNHRVEVDVAQPRGGYLFLADSYVPDWRVHVDGQPRPMLRANAVARAVWLEPGAHRVVFTYHPAALGWSALVALVAWLAYLAAWGERHRQPK